MKKTKEQLIKQIEKLNQDLKEIELQEQQKEFITIKTKEMEFRIYKWENKPYKNFPMPKGFDWCEYFDFVKLINEDKIKLEQYPSMYITKNQFKQNIKNGYGVSRLYLDRDLSLGTRGGNLASSDNTGRVVVSKRL